MSESVKILMGAMSETKAPATGKAETDFNEAFTLYHRAVFRAARAVVRDGALAEDITQEVFLRLYKNSDAPADVEMLRAWLLRIALNLSHNALRGSFRANAREEKFFKEREENFIVQPDVDLEKREQSKAVRRALDKIKEPLRSCLILKQQGLSYREIAESLSLNETSVGTFVARARREFLRFYGKIGSEKTL